MKELRPNLGSHSQRYCKWAVSTLQDKFTLQQDQYTHHTRMYSGSRRRHTESTPSYGTAGPDWDACSTRTERYRKEFSCSTVWYRFSRTTKKLHLILVHVKLLLTLSESVFHFLCSHQKMKVACVSKELDLLHGRMMENVSTLLLLFPIPSKWLLFPDVKHVLFSKHHVLYDIKHAKFHENLSVFIK